MRNYRTFIEDLAFTVLDEVPIGWLVVMTGSSLTIFVFSIILAVVTRR